MLKVFNASDFDKIKDRKSRKDFLKIPDYPSKENFLKELERGSTERFDDNVESFREFRRDLFHFLQDELNDIIERPFPKELLNLYNKGQLSNWEILHNYTKAFREYLKSINVEFSKAYVISRSVGNYGLNDPFNRNRTGDFRILYEYLDGKVLFTNVDYHIYRDSLYSVNR